MVNILSFDKNSGERYRAHGSSCLNPERFAKKNNNEKKSAKDKKHTCKITQGCKDPSFCEWIFKLFASSVV